MVQAQAAIVALVITLTLIAIQMAAASYTPRVVDVMKKNPDMWFLLIIYLAAISFGFIVLKQVAPDTDPFLVSLVLIVGISTFAILVLYMWNIIALLRPDKIVTMLVGEINAKNIHQKEWTDDIMQPVFDVVHASINRFDITTTRTGLNLLSERILELYPMFDKFAKNDINEHFCKHIQRSSLIALGNEDEGTIEEILSVLEKFSIGICEYDDVGKDLDFVISVIRFIGINAANKGLENATISVVQTLSVVGKHATDQELDDSTMTVVNTFCVVGKHAADKGLGRATRSVTHALREVGEQTADKGLELATRNVVDVLSVIGKHAADKGLERATRSVTFALINVGRHAADKGLERAIISVADALSVIGKHAADNELVEATDVVALVLRELGEYAADKGQVDAIISVADSLWELGEYAANKGLVESIGWVAGALRGVGELTASKGLRAGTENIVRRLYHIGSKSIGKDVAVKNLAELQFNHNEMISIIIDDIQYEIVPSEKAQFDDFLDQVNEELKKLKSDR